MQAIQTPTSAAEVHHFPDQAPLTISAETLQAWIVDSAVLLIDVREPHEFERERIAGAFLVSMSRFDAATFPRVPGMKTVLVSEQDARSLALVERLTDEGFTPVFALSGGLAAWRTAGYDLDE
ncbi:MAG: rhodanese-like domain-containing protein [Rhodospirillaceae bacterium]|jgi:rhodanese-related sulfurtransferase|nr:rhodanese-like domain-containing protein [Rhodospirillaceae bacterium]